MSRKRIALRPVTFGELCGSRKVYDPLAISIREKVKNRRGLVYVNVSIVDLSEVPAAYGNRRTCFHIYIHHKVCIELAEKLKAPGKNAQEVLFSMKTFNLDNKIYLK